MSKESKAILVVIGAWVITGLFSFGVNRAAGNYVRKVLS